MIAPVHTMARRPIAAAKPKAAVRQDKTTIWGKALVLCALTLAASAFADIRPRAFGFLIHPVSLGGGILFLVGLFSLRRVPGHILLALFLFLVAFGVSCFAGPAGGMSFFSKVAASAILILACAMYVRTEADFRWAALAMSIAIAIISLRGVSMLEASGSRGVNPLGGIANRNAFSLYALPSLLLAGLAAMRSQTPNWMRLTFIVTSLLTIFTVFSTGNRSGWGGVVLIAAMVALPAMRRRGALLSLIALTGTAVVLFLEYGNMEIIEARVKVTQANSPEVRLRFLASAIEVGLDKPLLGSSPQGLPHAMARLSSVVGADYDSHNVSALIFGGTGMLGLFTILALSWVLWSRPRQRATPQNTDIREVHYMLRAAMILWFLRGQFTAEVLYSPSLSLALGICIGACVTYGVWTKPPPAPRKQVMRTLRPTPLAPSASPQ